MTEKLFGNIFFAKSSPKNTVNNRNDIDHRIITYDDILGPRYCTMVMIIMKSSTFDFLVAILSIQHYRFDNFCWVFPWSS